MKDALQIAQAALGLWLVPWLPVFVAVLAAWAFGWAFPALASVVFTLGWPVTVYLWLRSPDNAGNS